MRCSGTDKYMSPERQRGEPHGKPSDVWAVGVTLAEFALGFYPYDIEGITDDFERAGRLAVPVDVTHFSQQLQQLMSLSPPRLGSGDRPAGDDSPLDGDGASPDDITPSGVDPGDAAGGGGGAGSSSNAVKAPAPYGYPRLGRLRAVPLTSVFADFIRLATLPVASQRPTAQELLEHPFFKQWSRPFNLKEYLAVRVPVPSEVYKEEYYRRKREKAQQQQQAMMAQMQMEAQQHSPQEGGGQPSPESPMRLLRAMSPSMTGDVEVTHC